MRTALILIGVQLAACFGAVAPLRSDVMPHVRHSLRPLHTSPRQTWKFSFELAFGDNSPYSKKYPSLYDLPYAANLAITRDVLDRIVPIALREAGAKRRQLLYAPSGYRQFPAVPAAQLDAAVSPRGLATMMDVLGYLAQQSEVIASRPLATGDKGAIQITERRGGGLASPARAQQFWVALRKRAPQLQGFLSLRVAGHPAWRVIDISGNWKSKDVRGFAGAVRRAARECHLVVRIRRLRVQLRTDDNAWAAAPDGGQYLRHLETRGQLGLKQRLVHEYRPRVEQWIRSALQRYAANRAPGRAATGNFCDVALRSPAIGV